MPVMPALAPVTFGSAFRSRVVYAKSAVTESSEPDKLSFDKMVSALMAALRPYDEARAAFVRVLDEKLGKAPPP